MRAAAVPEPAEAGRPPEARGLSRDCVRLLVASRDGLWHRRFRDLPDLLVPGDVLVINTSGAQPAALPATRANGAAATLHVSTPLPDDEGGRWVVELRRDGERLRGARPGEELALPGGARARLLAQYMGTRLWVASLDLAEPLSAYLERHGRPLRYGHVQGDWPLEQHQNVYALEPGSAESPSAGRPFTPELITQLVARGIDVAPIVLHTGVSSLEGNERPYPERYRVPWWTAERVNRARRVLAVGTTAVRALESAAAADGSIRPAAGWTDVVIGPERAVHTVDGILTGFHDGNSSHLLMLEAIGGRELIRRAYEEAVAAGYLRHEFGDAMLLQRESRTRSTRP